METKSKPLTSMVYEAIYADIVNGEITSNDILTEASLVQRFQVSKSPVREALIMLCEENVLKAIPRMGYRVIQITPSQRTKLIEARYALEPFLLEKAWDSIGELQIKQLRHNRQQCKEEEIIHTSIQDNWRRNIEFHLLLSSFAGNEYLQDALNKVLRACARATSQYYLTVRGIPKGDEDFHDKILCGLENHDFEQTMSALKADLQEIV